LSRAAFIADQKTSHGVPYAVACRALGVSESWFFKWHDRPPTPAEQRRAEVDQAVAAAFEASKGTYGSPRIHAELRAGGWRISEKTVAKSMARQGMAGRVKKRRKGLTRPDKRKRPFGDLLNRDFTAPAPNLKWCGDITEIPTDEGKFYLATALDLFSRRLLGYATSAHPDAVLAGQAIKMAVATRGGNVAGTIFHTDRGSTGEFNWSSHHLDHGGGRWDGGSRCRRRRRVLGGSGRRIGRCGRRCGHRAGLSRLVRCSGSSGG
jgi:putative transposase